MKTYYAINRTIRGSSPGMGKFRQAALGASQPHIQGLFLGPAAGA